MSFFRRARLGCSALLVVQVVLFTQHAAAACTAGNATSVSFQKDIQPLFNRRCVMCHLTGAANAELNLEPGLAYRNLVGIPSTESQLARVTAGVPEASYLVNKLKGTHTEVGGSGTQMPAGTTPLSAEKTELIESWIRDCAPDN